MFHIVAVSVYYCSLAYVLVAGIIYLATLLVLTSGKRCFFNRFEKKPARRKYRLAVVILVPLVFSLGWGFLIPFTGMRPDCIR